MLTDTDLGKVQQVAEQLKGPVTLELCGIRESEDFDRNLANTARQIAGVSANRILLDEDGTSPFVGKPCLTLSGAQGRNVHYLLVPEGFELDPFLSAIAWVGSAQDPPLTEETERLKALSSPSKVLVLAAAVCPHCPTVVRTLLSLAVTQRLIDLSIVDAVQFTDLADQYKVRATPTVIINDGATLVGQVSPEDVVSHLLSSDQSESLTDVVDSMIKAGRAEDAAALVCQRNQPEALLPLYVAPEFSVRMGALVALEEALEIDPRCLDSIVEQLVDLLSHEDAPLRGDTAVLLGKIGHPSVVPALKGLLEDPDEDVREVAQEALEEIEAASS